MKSLRKSGWLDAFSREKARQGLIVRNAGEMGILLPCALQDGRGWGLSGPA